MNQAFPSFGNDTIVTVSGKNFDLGSGDYYTAVVGPGAGLMLTSEGWLALSSGWMYVQIPHGSPGVPGLLWSPLRWPWVSGSGVRAGISGCFSGDHLIVTIDTPGVTRVFFGAAVVGSVNSIGKYETQSGIADIDPSTKFVEASTSGVVPKPISPADRDRYLSLRARAEELLRA